MPSPKLPRTHKLLGVNLPSIRKIVRFALLAAVVLVAVSLIMDWAKVFGLSLSDDGAITADVAVAPTTDAHADHEAGSEKARAGELHGEEPQPGIVSNLVTLLLSLIHI